MKFLQGAGALHNQELAPSYLLNLRTHWTIKAKILYYIDRDGTYPQC